MDDDRRRQIEGLFTRYGKGVGSYVLARVGDPDVAETITACAFLAVVRRFDQCHSSPVAWLWSIVRNEIALHFRTGRNRRDAAPLEAEPPDLSPDACDPHLRVERGETDDRLRAALARLTDEQQTLVHMKFFLDLSNVEIAAALGMTPSNVGVTAHRAVKRLRELMEPAPRPTGRGGRAPAAAGSVAVPI